MSWRDLFYIHPGFLAGTIIGILVYAIGVAHGVRIGRQIVIVGMGKSEIVK